jgi:asparagine synthase (glutamine-hydrolysing)
MCGIAGIFNYADPDRPVDRELLVRMTRTLAHRGPDAEGFYVNANIGLGHRRLSIVDLSPTGAQPMSSDDGRCWISYNGEFYNHQEFRPRLQARGAHFRGTSDTETLLRLMEQEGPESLPDAAGIFAFAFWDGRTQALTLARDHLGVKQVYYHDDGRRIVFASEIKALLQDPAVARTVDPEAVNQYLHFHTALFERTFFRDVRVLRAGEFLRITRYGANLRTYWSLQDFKKSSHSEGELVDELRGQLKQVVSRQLMSDVPVGSFFSGGIDSCAIAAEASGLDKKPLCFGVHFTDQGVTDERPFQEAAAQALGLDLQLITMDGSTFPDDFRRLMYHQDEPVIGQAMFPMAKVSELASSQVKVCLGGQAADEIFGGYARYALGSPIHVIRSMFSGRQRVALDVGAGEPHGVRQVGGNLSRQFAEGGTIYRLIRNARHLGSWQASYFEHFAKIPQESWTRVFADPDFCARDRCRQIFQETVGRSAATNPMDKIMHWDTQTYLAGLFHQDDRMSMAASLESRVPFADPKMVAFAFHVDPDLKMRGGASKWILRQAVSEVLPSLVLNRRKVGFDTPAQRWMRGPHAGFVRDILLSTRARQRGFWNSAALESLLDHPGGSGWFEVVWKVLSIELWASIFLDEVPSPPPVAVPAASDESIPLAKTLQYLARECMELGVKGTMARGLWEVKTRSGLVQVNSATSGDRPREIALDTSAVRLPFSDPADVAAVMKDLMPAGRLEHLRHLASEGTRGRIECFSGWMADYGNPIDWHRDPTNGHRWPAGAHWSRVLQGSSGVDIKFVWEAARFPHAYAMARAATFDPSSAPDLAGAFCSQLLRFAESNPPGRGPHWYSGQEVALRMFAWLFGYHVFDSTGLIPEPVKRVLASSLYDSGSHIADHIAYARDSIYNNHLLSEALGLVVAGRLISGHMGDRWCAEGLENLDLQAGKQIYPDGAYIQQSHNYHRVAMQIYLWAAAFLRRNGKRPPPEWTAAMERSLDFLLAHQNVRDGSVPNFGANDGSRPLLLADAHLSDFRPTLQALSVATRGERLYGPGPWDEMALWLCGTDVPGLPLRKPKHTSVSFSHTGYHVLRGNDPSSFCAFRCGTILDRFAQMDMLHVDICWRGHNVLVDGGSYRYNGAARWHNHFLRTEIHNTVQVDGLDQMLHFRQFKTLYPTSAKLLRFEDNADWALCEGEQYGFLRESGCTHRRAVLFAKDDLWVVADTVGGADAHEVRLHWLAGDYPFEFDAPNARLRLQTPAGRFDISVLDAAGAPLDDVDVICGGDAGPRGWQSLHYGEKVAVPSLVAKIKACLPVTLISVMSEAGAEVTVSGEDWTVAVNGKGVQFRLSNGCFSSVAFIGVPVLQA